MHVSMSNNLINFYGDKLPSALYSMGKQLPKQISKINNRLIQLGRERDLSAIMLFIS